MRSAAILPLRADHGADHRPQADVLRATIFYGIAFLLLFGPLAFGAVEQWSIFVLEAGAALLFVLWAIRQLLAGELHLLGNPLFAPIAVFAILIAVQLATGRTSYYYQTRSEALLYCAYGVLCFLIVQCLRRTSQIQTLAWLFCGFGFGLAVFALMQSLMPNGKLYWLRTPGAGGWIYGPYVNHNHYAGLMEMLVPIPLVVSLLPSIPVPRRAVAGVAAAVMAATVFLCGSRGGMLALLVEIALLIAMVIKNRRGRTATLALGLFLVLAAGMLVWLGGEELSSRIASIHSQTRSELSQGMRIAIARDSLRMFKVKPVLGWGLGTFPTVYPQFRTFYTDMFVNEAHNDYAQLLVEMGGLGFAAMMWFVAAVYYHGAKKLGDWGTDVNGAVSLAALLGVTGLLVHSFVDFNLQIPANAAFFYVLCVIAAMGPRFGSSRRGRSRVRQIA